MSTSEALWMDAPTTERPVRRGTPLTTPALDGSILFASNQRPELRMLLRSASPTENSKPPGLLSVEDCADYRALSTCAARVYRHSQTPSTESLRIPSIGDWGMSIPIAVVAGASFYTEYLAPMRASEGPEITWAGAIGAAALPSTVMLPALAVQPLREPRFAEALLKNLQAENPGGLLKLAIDETWSPFQRARVVSKLGELLPSEAVEDGLERLALDAAPIVREAVVRALDSVLPQARARAILRRMAENEPNATVGEVLQDVLSFADDE